MYLDDEAIDSIVDRSVFNSRKKKLAYNISLSDNLSSLQREAVKRALKIISESVSVNFMLTDGYFGSDLYIKNSDLPDNVNGMQTEVLGLLEMTSDRDYTEEGGGGFKTLLHELCHFLGMDHADDPGSLIPIEFRNIGATIEMQHAVPDSQPSPFTLRQVDLAVLQSLYGARSKNRGGILITYTITIEEINSA